MRYAGGICYLQSNHVQFVLNGMAKTSEPVLAADRACKQAEFDAHGTVPQDALGKLDCRDLPIALSSDNGG